LLDNVDPDNRQQTAETLSGLLVWYRDLVDDELITAWKGDGRANLPALMAPLADSRVASAIVDFSWRQQHPAAFNLKYAPLLGDLMARYPASADTFLHDLLGPAAGGGQMLDLSQPVADAVCRILLDMPDAGKLEEDSATDPSSLPADSPKSSRSGFAWERPGKDVSGSVLAGRSQIECTWRDDRSAKAAQQFVVDLFAGCGPSARRKSDNIRFVAASPYCRPVIREVRRVRRCASKGIFHGTVPFPV
jgi:hypothetical protein